MMGIRNEDFNRIFKNKPYKRSVVEIKHLQFKNVPKWAKDNLKIYICWVARLECGHVLGPYTKVIARVNDWPTKMDCLECKKEMDKNDE